MDSTLPKPAENEAEWTRVFEALKAAKPTWREDGYGLQGPPDKRSDATSSKTRFPDISQGKLVADA